MKQRWKTLLALATLCLLLAGCSQEQATTTTPAVTPEVTQEAVQEPEQVPEEVSAFPMTVVDQAGREVRIETKPEAVVSGYYIATSSVIALGLEDKVVGVENKAETRPVYTLSDTEFLDVPGLGTMKEFNIEACVALSPDLVILPLALEESADILADMGIAALCINPEDQALLEESIALIATATGVEARGAELIAYMQEKIQALDALLAGVTPYDVYLSSGSELLNTAGAKMYQSTLIAQSGNANVAAELEDTYWATISYEQLLAYAPSYMVIASSPSYSVEDVLQDSILAGVPAVEQGQVYAMPSSVEAWDSPVPSSFLGSYWIASITHGDVVSADLFVQEVTEFYETFYEFTPSEIS